MQVLLSGDQRLGVNDLHFCFCSESILFVHSFDIGTTKGSKKTYEMGGPLCKKNLGSSQQLFNKE